jgi:hypothetical protein
MNVSLNCHANAMSYRSSFFLALWGTFSRLGPARARRRDEELASPLARASILSNQRPHSLDRQVLATKPSPYLRFRVPVSLAKEKIFMFGAHLTGGGSFVARRHIVILALFAAAISRCGGSSRTASSSASGSPGDDNSDEGGLIFARSPSSSASDDASEASSDAPSALSSEASSDAAREAEADTFICDPTQTPKDAACIINDAYGVFVAPPASVDGGLGGSDDTGDGTMAQPFATIGKALLNLNGKSRVLICSGIYPERVSIDAAHAASLYGGLSCGAGLNGLAWHYTGAVAEARPPVADRAALTISGVTTPLAIEDMGFEAPDTQAQDPSGAGLSSIAAWVNSSTVSFARVVLTAGDGAKGADGTTLVNYDLSAPVAPTPVNTTDPLSQVCPPGAISPPADSTVGGHGALVAPMGSPGGAYPATVGVPPRDGLGGISNYGDYAFPGDDGADGNPRVAGVAAPSFGTLTSTAWLPAPGGDGSAGTPGQGGGGGGSLPVAPGSSVSYFGGAGGTGGCGGGGGAGGKGGGASVALFSIGSTVTLTTCQLASNQAGDGGDGGVGGPGQAGSPGHVVLYAGNGGMGGNGAGGSGGAGGTGGISAGIVYQGSKPASDASTMISLSHGTGAGAAGLGGGVGVGGANASGDAPDGSAGGPGLPGAYFTAQEVVAP